jgi:hypothetical protein
MAGRYLYASRPECPCGSGLSAGKAQIWQHVLAKFDADGDGTLNEQERKAAWQAFQKRMQDRATK